MVTQQDRPDALELQRKWQMRRTRNRNLGAIAAVAAIATFGRLGTSLCGRSPSRNRTPWKGPGPGPNYCLPVDAGTCAFLACDLLSFERVVAAAVDGFSPISRKVPSAVFIFRNERAAWK